MPGNRLCTFMFSYLLTTTTKACVARDFLPHQAYCDSTCNYKAVY